MQERFTVYTKPHKLLNLCKFVFSGVHSLEGRVKLQIRVERSRGKATPWAP